MTPNERALLLAVAKFCRSDMPETYDAVLVAIAAVEAEAAFAADDEAELAEVAEKARACEEAVGKECGTCRYDTRDACIAGDGECLPPTLGLWQPKPSVCPTCNGLGFTSLGNGMYPDCPDCNGTGKKESYHG